MSETFRETLDRCPCYCGEPDGAHMLGEHKLIGEMFDRILSDGVPPSNVVTGDTE